MAIKLTNLDKSKLVKNLAANTILVPFLDKELSTFDEEWEFKYETKGDDTAWHPSGDCVPPASALYARANKPYEHITGQILKSFMVGHFWHQWIQYVVVNKLELATPRDIERVAQKGWGMHTNGTPPIYQPFHWTRGMGDIAPLITRKWRGVVDIKTMSSNQFKQNTLPEWAAPKYTCQLNIYMDLFDEERGMILAVNKDGPHDFKEITFERDQELIDAIYRKWQFVSTCLATNHIPTDQEDEEYTLPIT